MKSFRKVLLIITVIALLCVLVACGENAGTGSTPNQGEQGSQGGEQGGGGQEQGGSEVKPLDTPYLMLDGAVAYWKPIDNANGYELEVNGEYYGATEETSYKLQVGESLRVKAISGDPNKYKDSAFSNTVKYNEAAKEKLDTPMIKIDYTDGRQVYWESVDNATSYVCEIDGGESVIEGRRIGPYNFGTVVRVKARDDNGEYTDSDYSESVTIGAMSDCTQVTDLSEYVGTYMTYDAEHYVVVGEDNKVVIHFSVDRDAYSYTEEVEIFVKQEDENTMILAKFDDHTEIVTKVQGAQAAFDLRYETYDKLVEGNDFSDRGEREDIYGIYCNFNEQNEYYFAELTPTALIADGVSYKFYKFADTIEHFNGTFYYDNGKYVDLDLQEGFRFNKKSYSIVKQATNIPYEDYTGKDDYRLLLREGDIVFLTYAKEDGKVYFNLDLGTGITRQKSLWVMGKDYCYFSPTDENDLTTLKQVQIESDYVIFGESLRFDKICEKNLYDWFYVTTSGNFVSADFVSTNLTSMITVDKYGQFLTKFGANRTQTDFKVFGTSQTYGSDSYRLVQIDGKYYRISFEANEENNYKTEEIRMVVDSSSGDSVERYCLMEDVSFDFNGTYRNNGDSIVLTKDGKLTYDDVEYQVVTIDGKKYARNASTFKRIATVDENKFQFVSEALYATSDLIEATIDEVLGDLDLSDRYQRIVWGKDAEFRSFYVYDGTVYYQFEGATNGGEATLYMDVSQKLTAIKTANCTYPAYIATNEDGEATIVIDGYEYYKSKTATIPEKYFGKRYYTFNEEDNYSYAQNTLYFANVWDGSEYVKGLFVLNAYDKNIVHTSRSYSYRILEDFDYLQESYFTKESELSVIGNVYYNYASHCTFEFRADGSLMYNGTVYYEVKRADSVPVEYQGSYYDQYRRVIEIIDDSAVRTETSRVEVLTSPKKLSNVYYIQNERGAKLYLKDYYQTTKYSQSKVDLNTHPLRQLVGTNLVKLRETTSSLAKEFIKTGTYYTRFYNDLYDGYDSHYYEGNGHLDYFALTFRSYNDVTYVRNAAGYSTTNSKYGNIDSSKIYFPQASTTAIISQNNVQNRCYYYVNEFKEFCFVYQFATEAIQICFDSELRYQPDVEKTAKFYIYERTSIGYSATDNRYSLVWNNDEFMLKYVSIIEPTELPDGMLGNYLMIRACPDGVFGVYNTDLNKYHRIYKASDGKFKFQELSVCNNGDLIGKFSFFDYDIRYDEATGRYLYGYYRTWTENTALKIDAASDFEPVGELIYDNGTLTVISFNARQSVPIYNVTTYYVTENESTYAKFVATDVNFASLGMVGKTYFDMDFGGLSVHTIVRVTNADTVSMYLNIGSLDFFDAKLLITKAVENATDNSVKYVGYLFSVDDETSVYIPIEITKYESGEIEFNFNYLDNNIDSYDDFVITEVHESNVLKGVEGVVEFKSRQTQEGKELTETVIFDSENNTITFNIGDNYEGDNLQTYTVTTFYYNADETMMYCFAGGRVFFFTFVDGKIETTLQVQFVARKLTGNGVAWFEFYVPEETEGGETEGGESSGETNA